MRFALICAVAGVLVGVPASASAFCRTTTSKAPAGYNPAVSGCWTEGVPLAWGASSVPYAVAAGGSKQVTAAEATRVADLAFAAWNAATCDGKPLGIHAFDDGPVEVPDGSEGDALAGWSYCTDISQCDPAAHDVIVFDDTSWPYNDPVNTLALTTVTYGVDDGHIAEAYTEVNSAEHQLTTQEPPPDGSGAFDLQAILTHEAGHFLGMAHATETTSIMYAYYQPGAIELTPDDTEGICTVYPQPSPKGCACGIGGTGGGGIAAGTLGLGLLAVFRRRRRTGSSSGRRTMSSGRAVLS